MNRIVALLAVAALGCARVAKALPATPQESARGSSSVQFVVDPANPAKDLPKGTKLHTPLLTDLKLPEYPSRALVAKAGATVGLRFVAGVDGIVTGVTESPLVPSTAGPFKDEFRASAERTVRGWNFQPAWLAKLDDGPDNDGDGKPDYKIAATMEAVPVYLDVRVEFAIMGGKGTVRVSGLPGRR